MINTLLIYFLSLQFLSKKEYTPFINAAFLTALLFGVHPIQTEAVTYISGRSISMMAMFYLGSILFYLKGVETQRHLWTHVLSPLFFLLAVLTRETAVTVPVALLLWEMADEEDKKLRQVLRRQAVHWILLAAILVALMTHIHYERLLEFSFTIRTIHENLLSQINGIPYLLSRLFALNGLNIDPDLPVVLNWTWVLGLKAFFLVNLFVLAFMNFRRNRWVFLGIAWFFLHLIPTNSVVPRLDIANERHLYLPVWGIFFIISISLEKLKMTFSRQKYSIDFVIITLVMIAGYFTLMRNHVYRSEVALWQDTVSKSYHKPRAHNNLGYAYELEGRYEEAKKEYIKALRLKPDYDLARDNLIRVSAHG